MKLRILGVGLAAATIFGISPSQGAPIITNGSFEEPPVATLLTVNPGNGLPGWIVAGNDVEILNVPGLAAGWPAAHDGNQYLDLVGVGVGGQISQSFSTVPGHTYKLTFAYGNNPYRPPSSATVAVSGAGGLLSQLITHGTSIPTDALWTVFSANFVADSIVATLFFTDASGNADGGIFLDAIAVADLGGRDIATPVPAAWPLFAAGLGVLGLLARRRSRKSKAA